MKMISRNLLLLAMAVVVMCSLPLAATSAAPLTELELAQIVDSKIPKWDDLIVDIRPDPTKPPITYAELFQRLQKFLQNLHKQGTPLPMFLSPEAANRKLARIDWPPISPSGGPLLYAPLMDVRVKDAVEHLCSLLGLRCLLVKEGFLISVPPKTAKK
ncbi:MAG: hypothetical protein HZA88_10745 [Verrucomicrobia bacterium]|nr:hypothetical protein [Verrucomicrobiota bacterium]